MQVHLDDVVPVQHLVGVLGVLAEVGGVRDNEAEVGLKEERPIEGWVPVAACPAPAAPGAMDIMALHSSLDLHARAAPRTCGALQLDSAPVHCCSVEGLLPRTLVHWLERRAPRSCACMTTAAAHLGTGQLVVEVEQVVGRHVLPAARGAASQQAAGRCYRCVCASGRVCLMRAARCRAAASASELPAAALPALALRRPHRQAEPGVQQARGACGKQLVVGAGT